MKPSATECSFTRKSKVTVTQHVKDIRTLSEAQNNQLQIAPDYEDLADATATAIATATQTPADPVSSLNIRSGKEISKSWTRAAHRTRNAAKRLCNGAP
uniref:Uncharacterized protein n=1 Tax=Peronospora matthiolae TaxID=2874970 RepID=A0AAV1UT69_9STRA